MYLFEYMHLEHQHVYSWIHLTDVNTVAYCTQQYYHFVSNIWVYKWIAENISCVCVALQPSGDTLVLSEY